MQGLEELAYSEAVRLCEGLDDDVVDIRRRAGTLLAALAISTAFLGGQVLQLGGANLGEALVFTLVVVSGCGLFLIVAILIVRIISPVKDWKRNLDATIILTDYERFSLNETYGQLASVRQEHYVHNKKKLGTLYKNFKVAATLFTIEILVWLLALTLLII